mmetsp:Transcript_52971/g.72344  ORF Transcript_52971/g.72344 Transcript_52971/m.72344 type:complete len:83 (-) Transcript_52971:315-563(-)
MHNTSSPLPQAKTELTSPTENDSSETYLQLEVTSMTPYPHQQKTPPPLRDSSRRRQFLREKNAHTHTDTHTLRGCGGAMLVG